MTAATKIKQQNRQVMLQVCERAGMTEQEYCETQYNAGVAFLKRKCIPMLVEQLERSAVFWGWWKVMWAGRDKWFLDDTRDRLAVNREGRLVKLPCRTKCYEYYHDLDMLVTGECGDIMREGLNQTATLILKSIRA